MTLTVLAPLRVEARALAGGAAGCRVVRTGAGATRAARAATAVAAGLGPGDCVAIAGVGGALDPALAPGDLVVADRVVDATGALVGELPAAVAVAAALRRAGLPARTGCVAASATLVRGGPARRALAERSGAVVVAMEDAALLRAGWGAPTVLVRAVADTPDRELLSPATLRGGLAALRSLRAAAPVLVRWAGALRERRVLLAGPRSWCAGVERAVATVERALDRFGAPVYVRRQIVHNTHVVADLEARGAVFVRELAEVPDGATVVLSAHGVAPAVRVEAADRQLRVVDATCPLVAKVHTEIRRFDARGYDIVLVGHPGHDETEGSTGHGDRVHVVDSAAGAAAVRVADPDRVAYVTQTTLSTDDTAPVVAALTDRFPSLVGPAGSDICYATTNRQDAVRAVAAEADVVVVLGSPTSSNAARLVEVAARCGTPATLLDDPADLDLDALAGAATVGVSAAASTPRSVVDAFVAALAGLGPVTVDERTVHTETISFPLPPEVR
ncbi:MAG TPA: 4-hydroxy-3-methylbut-2-enyl diphosphate reductase [Acidimicrobiales bacterium]|nr:4-hydroxy-3-methylbut-2-enyl diphosphate reductase [Acidimicrobiales bacterium]